MSMRDPVFLLLQGSIKTITTVAAAAVNASWAGDVLNSLAAPVLEIYNSSTSTVFVKTGTGYVPPANGALSQAATGTLAATTYFVKSTWVLNPDGPNLVTGQQVETVASAETSFAVALNNVLVVAAPASPPVNAIGWNVYVSATTGTETKQNTSLIALGAAWQEPTTGLIAGANPPVIAAAATDYPVPAGGTRRIGLHLPDDTVSVFLAAGGTVGSVYASRGMGGTSP